MGMTVKINRKMKIFDLVCISGFRSTRIQLVDYWPNRWVNSWRQKTWPLSREWIFYPGTIPALIPASRFQQYFLLAPQAAAGKPPPPHESVLSCRANLPVFRQTLRVALGWDTTSKAEPCRRHWPKRLRSSWAETSPHGSLHSSACFTALANFCTSGAE